MSLGLWQMSTIGKKHAAAREGGGGGGGAKLSAPSQRHFCDDEDFSHTPVELRSV